MRIDIPSARIAVEIRLRNPSRTMKIMLRAKPQFDFCPVCLSMPGEIPQKIQESGSWTRLLAAVDGGQFVSSSGSFYKSNGILSMINLSNFSEARP